MSEAIEAIAEGAALPEVTLEGPEGRVSLGALRAGRPLVVAFYAEDNTPTCRAQLCAFRDDYALIEERGAVLAAISVDAATAKRAFAAAERFPFPLLADPELVAARAFGVVDESGRRSRRAVFVTDAAGIVVAALPSYHPANPQQYQAVFAALGIRSA